MLTYAVLGATFAFAAVVQPGPLQAYLIGQIAMHGWRRTLPAALSPLISDGPIILIAVLVLSRLPGWFAFGLRLAGGVFVWYLAIEACRAWWAWNQRVEAPPRSGSQTLLKAAAVNILNPNPWLVWSLVLGPLLIRAWRAAPRYGVVLLVSFYGLVIVGLVIFIAIFGTAERLVRRARRTLMGLSALALGGFGSYLMWSGITAAR